MSSAASGAAGLAARAARAAAALDAAALGGGTLDSARAHLLDCLGMVLAGASDEGVRLAHRVTGPSDPALVLSLACAASGLDDFDEATRAHPGAVIVPALVAAAGAARTPVAGSDLLAGLIAGYQLISGLGAVMDAGTLHLRGRHPSAVLGPPAAALAVARMQRLPAETLASAIGIGASLSCGITEFDDRERMRAVQTGWAASAGVRAAQLAAAGFPASPHALEAAGGLAGRDLADPSALAGTELLGWPPFAVESVSFKPYPHFSDLHPVTAALIQVLDERPVAPDEIACIRARVTPPAASRLFAGTLPGNAKQARRSAAFVLATCVVSAHAGGRPAFDGAFDGERLADRGVLALASRVVLAADLPGDAAPAAVSVELVDGTTCSAQARGYPGDGRDPALRWRWAEVVPRFEQMCQLADCDATLGATLRHLVEGLTAVEDVRAPLARLLSLARP